MNLKHLVSLLVAAIMIFSLVTSSPANAAKEGNPMVLVKTNMGNFTIELYPDKAPVTVKNFLSYVDHKFYAGTIFHRVISTFMIQGGGFTPDMVQKEPSAPIKNEADNGLKNLKYTIAMARTNIVDSATCQFFINVQDNPNLDYRDKANYGYCVFGKVIEGMNVIDEMKMVKTTEKGSYKDVPVKPVIIKSITRVGPEE
jgi:cyclophilin family peptidyl-prolyl cis-trans isomerase